MREESFTPPGLPGGSSAAMPAGPAGPPPGAPAPAGSSRPVPVRPVFPDEDGEPFDVEEFFNPLSGPPEGADAWLAQVASPVADAWTNTLSGLAALNRCEFHDVHEQMGDCFRRDGHGQLALVARLLWRKT